MARAWASVAVLGLAGIVGLGQGKDVTFSLVSGKDGTSSLAFEQASDPASSFELATGVSNPGTLKVRTEAGKELFVLCGENCGKKADEQDKIEKEIEDVEGAAAAGGSGKDTQFIQVGGQSGRLRAQRRQAKAFRAMHQQQEEQQQQQHLAAKEELSDGSADGGGELMMAPKGAISNKGGSISMSGGGTLSVGGQEQWRMVVEESFPVGGVTNWVDGDSNPVEITASSTCARNVDETSDHFLGAFGHAKVSKKFTALPGHTRMRVTARAHFLDMWVGDLLYMKADGEVRWTKAHRFCTSTPEKSCQPGSLMTGALDTCLDPNFSDTLSVPIDVEWSHTGTDLELAFRGHLTDGTKCASSSDCKDSGIDCDIQLGICVNQKARWGIDDVRIYVR